jgi:hypothetical protein
MDAFYRGRALGNAYALAIAQRTMIQSTNHRLFVGRLRYAGE